MDGSDFDWGDPLDSPSDVTLPDDMGMHMRCVVHDRREQGGARALYIVEGYSLCQAHATEWLDQRDNG